MPVPAHDRGQIGYKPHYPTPPNVDQHHLTFLQTTGRPATKVLAGVLPAALHHQTQHGPDKSMPLAGQPDLRDSQLQELRRLGWGGRGVASHRPHLKATTRQPEGTARSRTHQFRRVLPPGCRVVGLHQDAPMRSRHPAVRVQAAPPPSRPILARTADFASVDGGSHPAAAPPTSSPYSLSTGCNEGWSPPRPWLTGRQKGAYMGGLSRTLVDTSAGRHHSSTPVAAAPILLPTEEIPGFTPCPPHSSGFRRHAAPSLDQLDQDQAVARP
jgi:hypothetical protein